MKKIIFLDFDGVLNTEHYQNYLMYQRLPWQDKHGAFFDPEAVRQLKRIVDVTKVLKTDDIHPPKTGISVHFSCSLPYWRCKCTILSASFGLRSSSAVTTSLTIPVWWLMTRIYPRRGAVWRISGVSTPILNTAASDSWFTCTKKVRFIRSRHIKCDYFRGI